MAFNQATEDTISFQSSLNLEQTDSNNTLPKFNPYKIEEKNFSFDKTEKVAYFKNPWIQLGTICFVGVPLLALILSGFGEPKQQKKASATAVADEEIARLQRSIQELEAKNQALQTAITLKNQKEIEFKSVSSVTEAPIPKPVVREIKKPPPQEAIAPKLVVRKIKKPLSQEAIVPKPIAKVDPLEKWQALSQRGYYLSSVSSAPQTSDSSESIHSVSSNATKNTEEILLSDRQLRERLETSSLYSTKKLQERMDVVVPPTTLSSSFSNKEKPTTTIAQNSSKLNTNTTLDIGSEAKAELVTTISWAKGFQVPEKKYLIVLKEGFQNVSGKEILPKGTKLIGKINQFDNSGLISMKIVQIIDRDREIKISDGTMIVEGTGGKPLQAKVKVQRNSDFLAEAGTIITPGIKEALNTTVDSISFNGENNSFSSISSNRDPLASGISGVAEGTQRVLDRRLSNNPRESVVYYQLKSGTTVNIVIYDNLSL